MSLISNVSEENEFILSVFGQEFTPEALKELQRDHGITFMSSGDGVTPVMVRGNMFAIGIEDDGNLFFNTHEDGSIDGIHIMWLPSLIADLQRAYAIWKVKNSGN